MWGNAGCWVMQCCHGVGALHPPTATSCFSFSLVVPFWILWPGSGPAALLKATRFAMRTESAFQEQPALIEPGRNEWSMN